MVRRDIVAFGKKSPTICQTNKTRVVMMTIKSMVNGSVLNTHSLLSHQFQNVVNEKATVIVTWVTDPIWHPFKYTPFQ